MDSNYSNTDSSANAKGSFADMAETGKDNEHPHASNAPDAGDALALDSNATTGKAMEIVPSENRLAAQKKDDGSPLILIVHASVGSGHKSAANAIEKAFELLKLEAQASIEDAGSAPHEDEASDLSGISDIGQVADLRTEVLDILDFGRIVFDGNATASMFTGVTRPYYDFTWRYTFTGHLLWGGGTIWAHVMYPKFVQYVREKKPAAIIATHITAANVAVSARMILHGHFPIICVPTDYEVEGLWPHLYTDMFCVADNRMAETLRPRKIPEKRIKVTGIPTSPGFAKAYDRDSTRKKYGLPLDKQQVLILAGASLPRPYIHFRAAIKELLPYISTYKDMHMVIIAGKDADYAAEVRQALEDYGIANATVLDYVEDMPALMSSSDLVVCKSGGLIVTECLNAQVPMVLLGRAYGQEKANVSMLTSTGAAFHVTTWRELVSLLHHINDSPESTRAILLNASFIRRPNAAMDIAKTTMQLIGQPKDETSRLYKKHFMHFYWGGKPAHIR